MLLEHKVAFVTGAGRGIGRAIAQTLQAEGALVYINASSEDSLSWADDRYHKVPFDVTDPKAIRSAMQRIKKEQGRLDILVNNAAVEYNEPLGLLSRDNREHMFQVNVYAVLEMIQLAIKLMKRAKQGSIINMSSTVGLYGNPGQVVYGATKGAINAITKTCAKELAADGIRVNALAPGLTGTDMVKQTDPKHLEGRISRIGFGRLATPEEIAKVVLFLASDLSSYISGQIIEAEGVTLK